MPSDGPDQPHESLRELASTTRDAVLIELQPLQQELAQVRRVLQEAGSQLQVAFLALNAQTRAQVAQVRKLHKRTHDSASQEELGSLGRGAEAHFRELERITALVGANIDDAVRALQFEDIATQLLECAQRRLSRVDGLAAHLQNIAVLLADVGESERLPNGILVRVRLRLARMREEYATTFLSPVAAPSLTGGEIEMF